MLVRNYNSFTVEDDKGFQFHFTDCNFYINVNKTIICSELNTNLIFIEMATREGFVACSHCGSLKCYKLIKYVALESENPTLPIQSSSSDVILVCKTQKFIPESVWSNLLTFEMLCILNRIYELSGFWHKFVFRSVTSFETLSEFGKS